MPPWSGAHQVVGRHLRQPRRRRAQAVAAASAARPGAARHHVARLDEGDVVAVGIGHLLVAQAHELVDVELVVGEQHEVLEPVGRRAGVVAQAVQRVVHARRGEQRQRLRLAGPCLAGAVGDAVVHRAQVRQVEHVAHQRAALGLQRAFDVIVLGEREMHRDRLRAGAHFQFDAVVLPQQAELLQVVVAIQVRPRERGLEAAGAGDEAVAQARVLQRVLARHRVGVDAHEGVAGPHMARQRFARDEALHGVAQVVDLLRVDDANLRQGAVRVGVAGGSDEGRHEGHEAYCATRNRRGPRVPPERETTSYKV